MHRGVAPLAEADEICGLVGTTGGPLEDVVHMRLFMLEGTSASDALEVVAAEDLSPGLLQVRRQPCPPRSEHWRNTSDLHLRGSLRSYA
jgi:hypothetical protein